MAARKFSLRLRFLLVFSVVLLSLVLVASVLAATTTQTTITDFTTGADIGSCYVGPSTADGTDGEITLLPTFSADFSDGNLPTGWSTLAWSGGGSATVSGGVMTVNNAVISGTLLNAPASIEFMALFSGASDALNQNAGFFNLNTAQNDFAAPWAFFGSWYEGTPTSYARTYDGSTSANAQISPSFLGGWHRFRIDWTSSDVVYSIDGSPVDTRLISLSTMSPMFSENGQQSLAVDWLRMGPYNTSCVYTSTVFDKGADAWWNTLAPLTTLPAGTTATFKVRFSTDGTNWAGWLTPKGGTGINTQQRFMQYQVTLTTSNSLLTPAVSSVTITSSENPTAITLQSLTARTAEMSGGVLLGALLLAAVSLALLLLGYQKMRANRPQRH